MSSYESNYRPRVVEKRVITPPPPQLSSLNMEAERRIEKRMNEIVDRFTEIGQNIEANNKKYSQEVQDIRRVQTQELSKIREEAITRSLKIKEEIGIEFGKVYSSFNSLKKETEKSLDLVNQKMNTIIDEMKNQNDSIANRRKELNLQIQLIDASLESINDLYPERYLDVKSKCVFLENEFNILKEAFRNGAVDEFVNAKKLLTKSIELESKVISLDLAYTNEKSILNEILDRNDLTINYLLNAQKDKSMIVEFKSKDKTHQIPLDLNFYANQFGEISIQKACEMNEEFKNRLNEKSLSFAKLMELGDEIKVHESNLGGFQTDKNEVNYVDGLIVKHAKELVEKSFLKQERGNEIKKNILKLGLADQCVDEGFINSNPNYSYKLTFKDSNQNTSVVLVSTDDSITLKTETYIVGSKLDEEDRIRKNKTLSLNICRIVGGEEPVLVSGCTHVSNEEELENHIRIKESTKLI